MGTSSRRELDALVAEAVIDAYDEFEQRIGVLDLPLPTPPPAGAQWIEAYRHWIG